MHVRCHAVQAGTHRPEPDGIWSNHAKLQFRSVGWCLTVVSVVTQDGAILLETTSHGPDLEQRIPQKPYTQQNFM